MIFTPTKLIGAYVIDVDPHMDQRGFFTRSFCRHEFEDLGLNPNLVQMNTGFSYKKGTLRGMHFQTPPHAEAKLVRCLRGAIFDVIIDLRPSSATHQQWLGVQLSQDNRRMLYVPEGFAHGYITLEDNTEMIYQTTEFYSKDHATGVRFDDPAFGISWPVDVAVVSTQDRGWKDYLVDQETP